jgi:hypothetical protein
MDRTRFLLRVFVLGEGGLPVALAGCAFPISPQGDLVTCRHVIERYDNDQKLLPVGVWDDRRSRLFPVRRVESADWGGLDLAVIPSAFGDEPTGDYFPVLDPDRLQIGDDVFTWGYYATDPRQLNRIRDGFFRGSLVSLEPGSAAVKETPYERLVLPYPVIEGLSGSPVLTYHNGAKVVGVCFASEALGVQAYEVTEVREGGIERREELRRIVEFGLAYPPGLLIDWLQDAGFAPEVVSIEAVSSPGLI